MRRKTVAPVSCDHVFRWDLDKTYLRSEFERVRDLIKSAFESAEDKRAVPGAPTLLRALRKQGGSRHRICIVSGSPTQMRAVLEAKLLLDGVEYDEFVLKNNLANVLRGRFRALRSQIPYKLPALLASRSGLEGAPSETLFGDDAESDALIYSVYADILSGRMRKSELEDVLDGVLAYEDERTAVLRHFDTLSGSGDSVKRILIHLDKRSPTASYFPYGPRLVPIYNYFQAALVLFQDRSLSVGGVIDVGVDMVATQDYHLSSLANSLQDLLWRGRLSRETGVRLAAEVRELGSSWSARWPDAPSAEAVAAVFLARVRELGAHRLPQPDVPDRIDYAGLARVGHSRRPHS